MRRSVLAAIVPGALISLFLAREALATPSSGLSTTLHPPGRFGDIEVKSETEDVFELELKTRGASDVYVVHNTFSASGGSSGWHTHPGPSLITVTSGTITAYDATCTPHVYTAGTGFVDGGDHVHLLRNEGSVPAETIAVQFLPAGASRRIDAPAPSGCPI
jgi:quercetin dioxygenase-like cupin family protein